MFSRQTTPTSDESESQTHQVTANSAQTNINIIQLALMLVGIPVSDHLNLDLLNIGEMNSAEIENFATIIQNLAESAPELIQDGLIQTAGEEANSVVYLLLELEEQLQNFGSIISELEADEHETPTVATIRRDRRTLIGVALNEQISRTHRFLIPWGNEHERFALLDALLGTRLPSPPLFSSIGETVDEMTSLVYAHEYSVETFIRLRRKIAILRQVLEEDGFDNDMRKVVEHLHIITEALDQIEMRFLGETPATELEALTIDEQADRLTNRIEMLNQLIAHREDELEDAAPGSAWVEVLQARIENLLTQRNMTANELLQLIKQKPQQQNPDATPEPADMETDGSKGKTTFDKLKLKPSEGATGGSGRGGNEDRDGDEGDGLSRRGGNGGRGNEPPEDGARRVNMVRNTSERTMKELVMWVAKNLENLNTGDEDKARGAEKTVRMIFGDIVKSPESVAVLQRLINEFLQKEYPDDAARLLAEAHQSLAGESLEIPEDIAAHIRVMMRVKRTLRLSMMLMKDDIISQEDLRKVKEDYSVVLGATFRAVDSVTFVDNPEWVVSATHNGEDLLSNEDYKELMLERIKDTDFAQLTDPEAIEEAEPAEAEMMDTWAAFMRDASRTPYSLTYVGGTGSGAVFRILRSYPLFNAKKQ